MIRQLSYNTSRDMKRLKELLDQGYDVVCFYSYDWNRFNKDKPDYKPMPTTDVCIARYQEAGEYSRYTIGCRGTGFLDYWLHGIDYDYTFIELLESEDIQFIEPNLTPSTASPAKHNEKEI